MTELMRLTVERAPSSRRPRRRRVPRASRVPPRTRCPWPPDGPPRQSDHHLELSDTCEPAPRVPAGRVRPASHGHHRLRHRARSGRADGGSSRRWHLLPRPSSCSTTARRCSRTCRRRKACLIASADLAGHGASLAHARGCAARGSDAARRSRSGRTARSAPRSTSRDWRRRTSWSVRSARASCARAQAALAARRRMMRAWHRTWRITDALRSAHGWAVAASDVSRMHAARHRGCRLRSDGAIS